MVDKKDWSSTPPEDASKEEAPTRPLTPTIMIQTSDGLALTASDANSGGHISDSDATDGDLRKNSTLEPSDSKKRTRKRSTKACELEIKIGSQLSRLKLLSDIEAVASTLTVTEGAASLKARIAIAEQEWHQFSIAHDCLASNATEELLQHSYIKEGIFDVAYRSYLGARTRLVTLINTLDTPAQPTQAQNSAQRLISTVTLAPLNITPFSGDYAKWPEFRDMFTSVVINRAGLEDVERLHYLKTYLEGQAAQAIANTTMCNESFALAWDTICKRYNVPRLLIGAQLDKLLNLPTLTTRSSKQLYSLIDQTTEALNALAAQKVDLTGGDYYLLTHLIISKLDRSTRESWELSLGASVEFPKLRHLRQFLTDRARAQERYEEGTSKAGDLQKSNQHSKSSSRPSKGTSYAHMAITATQPAPAAPSAPAAHPKVTPAQYPCDVCQGDHYVVRCSQFGRMTPDERAQVVIQARLCPNCLGHHRVDACKSKFRCRLCQGAHHSMIHPGLTDPPGSSASAPAQ